MPGAKLGGTIVWDLCVDSVRGLMCPLPIWNGSEDVVMSM